MRPNAAGSDPWVQQACSVPIEDELARRGIHLRGKIERAGPCPVCGGLKNCDEMSVGNCDLFIAVATASMENVFILRMIKSDRVTE